MIAIWDNPVVVHMSMQLLGEFPRDKTILEKKAICRTSEGKFAFGHVFEK